MANVNRGDASLDSLRHFLNTIMSIILLYKLRVLTGFRLDTQAALQATKVIGYEESERLDVNGALTFDQVAAELNRRNMDTPRKKGPWQAAQVQRSNTA